MNPEERVRYQLELEAEEKEADREVAEAEEKLIFGIDLVKKLAAAGVKIIITSSDCYQGSAYRCADWTKVSAEEGTLTEYHRHEGDRARGEGTSEDLSSKKIELPEKWILLHTRSIDILGSTQDEIRVELYDQGEVILTLCGSESNNCQAYEDWQVREIAWQNFSEGEYKSLEELRDYLHQKKEETM